MPSAPELDEAAATFARLRPRLFGIAYRMLGSVGDAEDVVQDAWIRWQEYDRSAVRDPAAGAVVVFTGTTRRTSAGRRVVRLEYEAHETMALREMRRLAAEAKRRWRLEKVAMVHRVGLVPVGEPSVVIAVSAGHREEAFAAGRWLIDTLKQVVPIWKQENFSDGTTEWVHPGMDQSTSEVSP